MITIALNAREYPANNSDNAWGDYCALVQLSIRAHHPVYRDQLVEIKHWMLISSVGKPPKILTEEEALKARANTFYGKENLCHTIQNSDEIHYPTPKEISDLINTEAQSITEKK